MDIIVDLDIIMFTGLWNVEVEQMLHEKARENTRTREQGKGKAQHKRTRGEISDQTTTKSRTGKLVQRGPNSWGLRSRKIRNLH